MRVHSLYRMGYIQVVIATGALQCSMLIPQSSYMIYRYPCPRYQCSNKDVRILWRFTFPYCVNGKFIILSPIERVSYVL